MTTQKEYQETPAKDKKKAQLKHVLFDSDFFDKPKIKALGYDHGQLAILYLMRLYAALSRATNATMETSAARGIAYEMHLEIDKADEIVTYCASKSILLIDGDQISSERVRADQEKLGEQQEKWREKQKKSRGCLKSVSGDIPERIPESLNTERLNTEDLNLDPKKIAKPGFVDLGDGVMLTVTDFDVLRLEFARFELPEKWIGRAAAYCANQDNQKYINGPFRYLKTWGIQRCLEEKDKLERTRNTEKMGKKMAVPNQNGRPNPSPPRIDEPEPQVIRHAPLEVKKVVKQAAQQASKEIKEEEDISDIVDCII